MARDDENQVLNTIRSPEDAEGHKVAVKYIFNPEKKRFYPDSGDLYSYEPKPHREQVTSKDTVDPPFEKGIDCEGFKRCRFDIHVQGVGMTSLKVKLLRWNSTTNTWFPNGSSIDLKDAEEFSSSEVNVCLIEDEAFGATIFLKVLDFVGGSFELWAYYILC